MRARARLPIGSLGLATLLFAACGPAILETAISVQRSASSPCRATVEGTSRPMNVYLVDVFIIPSGAKSATNEPVKCGDCLDDGSGTLPSPTSATFQTCLGEYGILLPLP